MQAGDEPVKKTSRASLRLLGSVGEPINPEAWEWYYRVVGDNRCPIVDTWWQTETGGILITPLPGATPLEARLGLAGRSSASSRQSSMPRARSWKAPARAISSSSIPGRARCAPSMAITTRFEQTYFSTYKNMYFTGDGCRRDADGYYWITGRVDDVINVSGHRMGTAEVESALVAHDESLRSRRRRLSARHQGAGHLCLCHADGGRRADATRCARNCATGCGREIGPIATPDLIQFAPGLPKTRSGKIMRRILRKIAEDEFGALGDISTLADPAVVEDLIANRQNQEGIRKSLTAAAKACDGLRHRLAQKSLAMPLFSQSP